MIEIIWINPSVILHGRLSQPSQWTVYAGYLTQIQMASATGNSVGRIISHEKYDKQTKDNDIALMKLNTLLTMSGKSLVNFKHLKHMFQWQITLGVWKNDTMM